MAISMYQAAVPVFVKTLGNLSGILSKGASFAAAKNVDPSVLLAYRLAPDMLDLCRQVRLATDHARNASARLAGVEAPALENNETTFDALTVRIDRSLAFLDTLTPAQIDGSEARDVVFKVGGNTRSFKGQAYLLHHAMPNFFFHVTTAYDILRHCGVDIGKRDFIGQV